MVDAAGHVAAHTGSSCMPYAGHVTGAGVSCQANIMATERVWPAMLEAFGAAGGSLTIRLLAALDAAEREGGDLRGRQSAAILVVGPDAEPWQTVVVAPRRGPPRAAARAPAPGGPERGVHLAGQADELQGSGHYDEAARLYAEASERAPGNHELLFWAGLGTAQAGDVDAGVAQVRAAIALQPTWRELLGSLPPRSPRRRPRCSRAWPANSRAGGPAPPARGPAAPASPRGSGRGSAATRFAPA